MMTMDHAIGTVIKAFIDDEKIPSALTLVARNGAIVHMATQGYADIGSKTLLKPDTIFRIYSMTKPVTAVAAMMLYEQGLFGLDDAIADYLPCFKSMQVFTDKGLVEAASPITIRQLLTHNAGLTYSTFTDYSDVAKLYGDAKIHDALGRQVWNLENHINRLAALPLIAHPGTVYEYSESLSVIARLVEVVSGQSYRDFLKSRIFEPLKMLDTDYYVPAHKAHRLATLYERDKSGRGFNQTFGYGGDYTEPAVLESGGAGLVSTAHDYLAFSQMLLAGGVSGGHLLLSPESVKQIMSDQYAGQYPLMVSDKVRPEVQGLGYGFGGYVVTDISQRDYLSTNGEYGWSGWASTHFWVDPDQQLIGMVLTQMIPQLDEMMRLGEVFRGVVYESLKINSAVDLI